MDWLVSFDDVPPHPRQPIIWHADEEPRFRGNAIVQHLLAVARKLGCGMNELAELQPEFDADDWEQFAQLIGYSVAGFCELYYVSADSKARAEAVIAHVAEESE
jgi:hypothetical protein